MSGRKGKTGAASSAPPKDGGNNNNGQQPQNTNNNNNGQAAPGNEKERLDQRLKKKIQAFRARKKDTNNLDNDSQKRNSHSSRKKKTEKDVLLAISLLRPGSIAEHFPQIFDSGELYFFRYVMMSLHGPNLERLRRDILKTDFTVSTALRVAYQILTAVVDLHLIGYVHRDLKPTNFVIGMDTGSEWFLRSTNLRTVYMVGFGTCVKKKVALEKNERRFVNLTFGSRKSHNFTGMYDFTPEQFKNIIQKSFVEISEVAGMYDFTPEQFKNIIQKSFVEISEGKSINTHVIREAFRDICKKNHITDGTPYDWEIGNSRNVRQNEGDEIIDGGAKKWMIPKGMQPKIVATAAAAGTTTTTIEDDDENDKVQEETNLDETPSVMLRRVVFEKNNENNGIEDIHSCPSLDPTIPQTLIKNAVDNDVKLRSKIPKAIPPDDPLLKLTINKSKKGIKAPALGQPQSPGAAAAKKLPPINRMKNGVPALNTNNNNNLNNAATNPSAVNPPNLVMRIKKDRSEDRDTTTTEDK
uniref:Protein kinase domain-containing protein n=1 Tax=Panagrolaimus sp. ES5 TaxID=591445 RepID=A0AC34FJ96_9BILA